MLDRNNPKDLEAINTLRGLATTMVGINFALAMRMPGGEIEIHPRENQPCQGGEMRKYRLDRDGKPLHADCTRPDDYRPSDLNDPFPDGIPEGIAVNFIDPSGMEDDVYDEQTGTYKKRDGSKFGEFLRAILSDVSPYRKACRDIEIVEDRGIVILDTDVDSTLLVNLLQAILFCRHYYQQYRDAGLTEQESLICSMLGQGNPLSYVVGTYDYYFPVSASMRRLLEGDFNDLTGGTFRDRFDYNRPKVQGLFKAQEGEVVTNWAKAQSSSDKIENYRDPYRGDVKRWKSMEDFAKFARETIWSTVKVEQEKAA